MVHLLLNKEIHNIVMKLITKICFFTVKIQRLFNGMAELFSELNLVESSFV